MNWSAAEVEEVVREVLLRIQSTTSLQVGKQPETEVAVVEIGDRVIATAQIAGIAENTRVRLHRKAVVTPAARDLAAERNLVLEKNGFKGEENLFYVVGQSTTRFTEVLANGLHLGQVLHAETTEECVLSIIARFTAMPNTRCVLLTEDIDIALCLANRSKMIRAVSVYDSQRLKKALIDVSANVLVLNPDQIAQADLAALCESFFTASKSERCSRLNAVMEKIN